MERKARREGRGEGRRISSKKKKKTTQLENYQISYID
jgi:hypothetical protein